MNENCDQNSDKTQYKNMPLHLNARVEMQQISFSVNQSLRCFPTTNRTVQFCVLSVYFFHTGADSHITEQESPGHQSDHIINDLWTYGVIKASHQLKCIYTIMKSFIVICISRCIDTRLPLVVTSSPFLPTYHSLLQVTVI